MKDSIAFQSILNLFPDVVLSKQNYFVSTNSTILLWVVDSMSFGKKLTSQQRSFLENSPPYWTTVWPAARALIDYFERNPVDFCGLKVLDFGAGSGAFSVYLAQRGAIVYAVDDAEECREVILHNANLNRVSVRVSESVPSVDFDICFVPDVLYEDKAHSTIENIISTSNCSYVADCLRKDYTNHDLERIATIPATTWPTEDHLNYNLVQIWCTRSKQMIK